MPGKIKVKVLAGRNLPVMDRASDTTDAFVEIKFGGVTHKTDVCRKSLNPHWSSTEWYRFEVDESELQDEPLQLRLMDHDTYSANDAIGKVVISLAPLLARESAQPAQGAAAPHGGAVMSGWIPVFDTMHGIRGELNVIVKVELFADFNKYKDSSCGVQFFHCPMIPPGYRATAIHGFVEELVVNDDPEYQWIDKIRTPRASNEARQVAFINLSNQVQRLVGLKAAELGANAVIGYQQDFDLEGEAGVVARAIGTAVNITAAPTPSQMLTIAPCSQQQLKKYLDILGMDNENIPDLNEYFKTHQEELQKLLNVLHPKYSSNFLDEGENVEDDEKSLMEQTRQFSIKGYTDSVSIYQDDYATQKSMRHLSEDQTDLNKLLNRIEDDSDSSSSGPIQTIKKIKTNFFTKRLGSLRSKKPAKPSEDQISIQSNSSDTSKISLGDIKNEFKKLRMKKPKFARKTFKNPHDEGTGMASILARSVIHAHTSLASIKETQDSEHSPCSTLRRTSESEPTINVLEEGMTLVTIVTENIESIGEEPAKIDTRCSSLINVNIETESFTRQRTLSESCPSTPVAGRSENLLKLPGEIGYFGSASSALSGESSEIYSSSEDDDESSDLKTDNERSFEKTTSVVQTILKQEAYPNLIIQMPDIKLEESESKPEEIKLDTLQAPEVENDRNQRIEASTSSEKFVRKERSHSIKFTNPFTHKNSVSAPSSPTEKHGFVYRSSRRIRRQLSKISKSTMIKSLSHISLIPKKKPAEAKPSLSQPASSSDVQSKSPSHETVLGSPFLSYTDLLVLDKDDHDTPREKLHKSDEITPIRKVEMYIGSEPASRASVSGPSSPHHGKDDYHFTEQRSHKRDKHLAIKSTGLLHTAMETILIDKVQSLLIPTSPDSHPTNANDKQFFDDVNQKLELVEEYRNNAEFAKVKERLDRIEQDSFAKNLEAPADEQLVLKTEDRKEEQSGLLHTAMETILIDKVQSLLIPPSPGSHPTKAKYNQFFDDVNQKLELVEESRNKDAEFAKAKEKLDRIEQDSFAKNLEVPADERLVLKTEDRKEEQSEVVSLYEEPKLIDHSPEPGNNRKLQRQDSIHDNESETPRKMSTETLIQPPKNPPMLQRFHPILSGAPLETIPSLPETTSRTESLDVEGVETNCVSVCVNTHADCLDLVDRSDGKERVSPKHSRHESYGREMLASANEKQASLNATSTPVGMHRRSSDSDLSVTPKGGSLNASGNAGSGGGAILRPSMNSNNLELLEYPFLTMTECPPGLIVHIGGCVCARSVKLVDGGGESAARAAWWAELRTELRAHARALRCNAVIAYTENTAICEDVCVLSASGTAAVINLDCDFNADLDASLAAAAQNGSKSTIEEVEMEYCGIAHVPYSPGTGPNRAELSHCGGCRRARVPSVLLATCAQPNRLASYAKAVTITAVAARVRRAAPQSEPGARDISDQLPFLEYELHKLLLAKLRMQGANAIFNLQTQIAVGERCVMALASGTAVKLAALPPPTPPTIKASENDKAALEIQKALWDTFNANRAANGYDTVPEVGLPVPEAAAESGEEPPALHLSADKDAALLELDETEDVETARVLASRRSHMQVYRSGMRPAAGAPPHAFAQVWRARFAPPSGGGGATAAAERHVARALDGIAYKLRRLRPCALLAPRIQLELPEDEIQLILSGAAIQLADPTKPEPNGLPDGVNNNSNHGNGSHGNGDGNHGDGSQGDADDEIFALDEDEVARKEKEYAETARVLEEKIVATSGQVPTTVSLTSLCHVSGARAVRRVCALRLLFVRETTAVRELGGLSGFLHTFTCEALAIARAYTAALGGNTLTSMFITQLMLQDNAPKNQGQCLLSVGGDVVHITY